MEGQRRRIGRTSWAASLACLALLLIPAAVAAMTHSPEPAFGPVKTVKAVGNSTSSSGESSFATASCPSGTKVTGGGFSSPYGPTGKLVVYQSFRSGSDSWTVAAVNAGGSGAAKAFAYCRKTKKKITDT